jgi:predicted nucleic acid-binding protein
MDRTLLDTDILSDFLRGKNAEVQDRARSYLREHGRLTISVVTVFEVVRGRYQASQVSRAIEFLAWVRSADVIPFDAECARVAGEMAGVLLRGGITVGVADVLIAATAIVHQVTVATANIAHYERMARFGLQVENWREG